MILRRMIPGKALAARSPEARTAESIMYAASLSLVGFVFIQRRKPSYSLGLFTLETS